MTANMIGDNYCCLICSESYEWKPISLRSRVNEATASDILFRTDDPHSGCSEEATGIRNDFKTALLLFCKLLKANRNGFGGEDDGEEEEEWFKSLGDIYEKTSAGGGETFEPPCCSGCYDALVEILRLQKVIKENLASQREHVERLKGSLVLHPTLDSKDDDGSCQVEMVRNRLISRTENNQHLDALVSKRRKSKPETGGNLSTSTTQSKSSAMKMKEICLRRKRPGPEATSQAFSLSNHVKPEEGDDQQEDPLRLSDVEFEAPPASPTEPIDGGDSRRRNKRKRNSWTEDDHNEVQIPVKDFGVVENGSKNECSSEGEEEYQPAKSDPINEDIPSSPRYDEPEGDDVSDSDDDDPDYSIPKGREKKRKVAKSTADSRSKNIKSTTTPQKPKRRRRKGGILPKSRGCPLFLSLGKDRLLYKSTLIKVSYGSGFTCEEEGCGAFIPGSDFDAFESLRSHISSSHETEEYYYKLSPCPLCSKPLRPLCLRRHMIGSHPSILAICEVCWRPLSLRGYNITSAHIWLHKSAEDKRAVLASGGKNVDLEMSKQRESQSRLTFRCDQCDKCFSSNPNLERHKVSHVPMEVRAKFECSQCGKMLLSETALQRHIGVIHNAHLDSRPRECRICGKRYHSQSGNSFSKHMKSHTGKIDRKVTCVCDVCGKVLMSKISLLGHLNTHSGEGQFQCEFCHMAYPHKRSLRRHQVSAHKEKVLRTDAQLSRKFSNPENMPGFIGPKLMYPCEVCGKAFPIMSRMRRHVTTAHHHEMV